ncbi:hypothetical protein Tco_0090553 [Tanacetum coccineum]
MPTRSEEFHQIVDFLAGSNIRYALIANPTIYVSLTEQFWQTVIVDTVNDGEQQLTVIVDGQTITITEASVRRHLQLADTNGISSFPNTEIFDQLTLMRYVSNDDKLTFQKGPTLTVESQHTHIASLSTSQFDSMLIHDQPSQGEGPTLPVESQHTPIASPTTSQPTISQPMSSQEQPSQVPTTEPIITTSSPPLYEITIPHTTSSMPHDSPLSGGDTPGSDEGSKKLNEFKHTKKVYGKALTKLVKKVKYLEDKLKSTTKRRKARMVISNDEEDLVLEDPSNQGRMTETKYEEVEYELDQTDTLQQLRSLQMHPEKDTAKEILSTDERIAQKLNEEEMAKSAAREEQERIDFEKALELQKQLDERKETDNIDWSIVAEQNMVGYKMGHLKGMSYDEIRPMFEEEYNKIQTLFKKDTEVEKTKTKRVAEETLLQESFKKLRTAEASSSEPIQEQPTEEPKELSKEELKKMLEIVPVEEIKAEALQVKEDLVTLWSLVKERFRSAEPTEDMERALWVELKRLFEPDKDDVLWKLQKYMHDPLTWRLYDTCGVHHVSSTRGHDIYMLTKKDYPLSTTVMGLMLSRRLQVEEDTKMARDLVMKIFRSQEAEVFGRILSEPKSYNSRNLMIWR